jgi:hypothetical protein
MQDSDFFVCSIEQGALTGVPAYTDHPRAKNWLARIKEDPRAPGGLARNFIPHGRGRFYYLTEGLVPGQAVEFGADYYTYRGNRDPHRWYGVVVQVDSAHLVLRKCDGPIQACRLAAEIEQNEGKLLELIREFRAWESAQQSEASEDKPTAAVEG